MAVRQYGNQDIQFGFTDSAAAAIAAAIGLRPTKFTPSKEPEFEAFAKNSFAETDAYVRGSPKGAATIEGYIVDAALFTQAIKGEVSATFTYESEVYITKGGDKTVSNEDFTMAKMEAVQFPLITDTTGTALN